MATFITTAAGGALFGGVAARWLRNSGPAGQWYDRDTTMAFLVGDSFHIAIVSGLAIGSALGARWAHSHKVWSSAGAGLACAAAVVTALTIAIRAAASVPPQCAVPFGWGPSLADVFVVGVPVAAAAASSAFVWRRGGPGGWLYALGAGLLSILGGELSAGYLDGIVESYFWHC